MKKERKRFLVHYFPSIKLLQFVVVIVLLILEADVNALDWDELFTPEGLAPKLTGTVRTVGASIPAVYVRGDNMFAVNAVANAEFTINVKHLQLSSYTDTASWSLRSQDNTVLDSGILVFNAYGEISYEHDKTEVIYLYVSTGRNCVKVTESDVTVALVSGVRTKFLGNYNKKLYMYIPEKTTSFTVTLTAGSSTENVKVKIYNSSSALVTSDETSSTQGTVDIDVSVGTDDDAIWYLEIDYPTNGILEDYALQVSAEIPPTLSFLSGDNFAYAPFGKNEKIRLMMDTTVPGSYSYNYDEWMIEDMQDIGFNVYVPRKFNGDTGKTGPDLTQFEELADWCDGLNMKTLAWLRGTHQPDDITNSTYDGIRYRPGATEYNILSPNSDEFWTYLTTRISAYATLSRTYPSILGVFIDFEDYYTPLASAYHISYDDDIIDLFEAEESITVNANPEDRKDWLINNNYHDDFVDFQLDHWRDCCAQLRATIDLINPQFRFFVYPYSPDLVYSSTAAPFIRGEDTPISKLSTQQAPIVHAEVTCYTDPYSIICDAEAIAHFVGINLDKNIDNIGHDKPYMMIAGFCPNVTNNLEFLARAPIVGAEKMDGYWAYNGNSDSEVMDYFEWANTEIIEEDYDSADISFTSVLPWYIFWLDGRMPKVEGVISHTNETFSSCQVRGDAIPMFISCEADEEVTIELSLEQIGSYTDPFSWELRFAGDMNTSLQRGTVAITESSETITFTPAYTGNYILGLSPNANYICIDEANAPLAFYAGEPVRFYQNTQPLYVNVPSGVTNFNISVKAGSSNKNVKVSIYSPNNTLIEEEETSSETQTQVISVTVGQYGSGAWKIVTAAPTEGSFSDFYLTVGPAIPQFLSLDDEHLFSQQAVGLWYFDEDSGSAAADFSGNGNNGMLTNMGTSTCWVDGKIGSALEFDGSDDYVDCGTDASLSFADGEAWSFEAWLYIEDSDGYWNAFTGAGSVSNKKFLMIHYNSYMYFTSDNGNYYSSSIGFTLDSWQHIAVTVDTSGNMRYYLNGVYKATVTPDTTEMDFYNIGRGNGSRKFDGIIDEVKIYDKTLSADEISDDYSEGI